MTKKLKNELILAIFPIASIILTAVSYPFIPNRIPSGYDLTGNVIAYADKSPILFIIPVLSIFFYLYFLIVPKIDIQHDGYRRFERSYNMMRLTGGAALALISVLYILNAFYPDRVEVIIAFKVSIAITLFFFGDRLPKIKRNHFIGVVNPWTLRSEKVWSLTQRFTGKMMFIIGLGLLVISFINIDWVNAVYFAVLLVLMIAPHIYSANKYYQKLRGGK